MGRKPRYIISLLAAAGVAAIAASFLSRHENSRAAQPPAPSAVPVSAASATQQDVPIYYRALGTVSALNTVAIRAQVNGQIVSVNFVQGQEVKKGDILARIDPAPFQAALDQAVAKKNEDQAMLIDAEKDLVRFKALVQKDFETQQNVDAQQAKVDQTKAMIEADQGAIEAAQTQLGFTTISAPIDGVVGFRQVDLGNIIHTTDPSPLTVLTQIRPCYVIYTLPQGDLGPVREAMLRGSVSVLAYDQDDKKQLAQGKLLLINNQIDQTTSTIQLKAEFDNNDGRLWPGEFVQIRTLINTQKDAVTIPPLALQRGPDGLYVWVIKPDNTVEQRPIDAQTSSDDTVIVSKGLAVGERVVVEGQSRLDTGTHIAVRHSSAAQPPPQRSQQQAGKA